MRKRLKSVLALLDGNTREQLVFNFLELNLRLSHFDALMVGMINSPEERVECYAVSGARGIDVQRFMVSVYDVNHPLIQVLRNGVATTWQTLHRGVRIEETRFRHFVYELPGECGLYARPVFDNQAAACGVIAAFSRQPEECDKPNSLFTLSCELFQHRLKKILELDQLRSHLRQIQDVFQVQQQKQKQLDELLSALSAGGAPNSVSGVANDYSEIDDLQAALEKFEYQVLTQRLRQFGADKKRVAMSLNLSPRTLTYKLAKYKGNL
ncbi:helix-turn-helix domain-containing protein [Entomohabitans teleogrylli]|uniref:helix-turn-helix domain-containing protein n=1 Tax=Entomohabitans teleogrylli TaxID=1384589 RepID=UPI00073D792E|nr:helix-turn-helix domain-containing protein [Entomohabitans teleogrylli]